MKKEFWIEKWENNQTGFHKDDLHLLLKKYIDSMKLKEGDRVFVPLCGKSVDMLWLDSLGFSVIAVELSQLAVEQFFSENNLVYELQQHGQFRIYQCGRIKIYQGDFFDLQLSDLSGVRAVYDRAAFIALPEDMTHDYVMHMQRIIPPEIRYMLVTLEFDKQSGPKGPPFSTDIEKVKVHYSTFNKIELLEEIDILHDEPKFKQQGCSFVTERVFLIE